jgi:hypothetical protein
MPYHQLELEIKESSEDTCMTRLIEYAQAMITQHPDWSLSQCLKALRRYRSTMDLSNTYYKIDYLHAHDKINIRYYDSPVLAVIDITPKSFKS